MGGVLFGETVNDVIVTKHEETPMIRKLTLVAALTAGVALPALAQKT